MIELIQIVKHNLSPIFMYHLDSKPSYSFALSPPESAYDNPLGSKPSIKNTIPMLKYSRRMMYLKEASFSWIVV